MANSRIKWRRKIGIWDIFYSVLLAGISSTWEYDSDQEIPVSMQLAESCLFPYKWTGTWFQSGVPTQILINQTQISSKGRCVRGDGDKYIVYSQSEECYRCVVFHEKHLNVLQYKETFCYPDLSALALRSFCRRIPGDAHLYSMFRLDATPIPCPFQGSFTFSYNRGHGVCHSPVSTLDTCSVPSQLVLNYQACPDVYGTESKVEELQCIAQWKEGSSRYVVALLKYLHDPSSYEERFRCYAYESSRLQSLVPPNPQRYSYPRPASTDSSVLPPPLDTVVYRVAQSGDATCQGLSPVEGARTLTLRSAVSSLQSPCTFPDWVQAHAQWLTLDGSLAYGFSDKILTVTNTSSAIEANGGDDEDDDVSTILTSGTCVSQTSGGSYVIRVTKGCQIGFVCLHLFQRDRHVLEIYTGRLSRDARLACVAIDLEHRSGDWVTLTTPTPDLRQCPYIGQFDLDPAVTGTRCHVGGTMVMGCGGGVDTVQFNGGCPSYRYFQNGNSYLCHGWWEDADGDMFLIVSSQESRHCVQIRSFVDLHSAEVKGQPYVTTYEDEGQMVDRSQKIFQVLIHLSNCGGSSTDTTVVAFNASNFSHCSSENAVQFSTILPSLELLLTVVASMTLLV